MKALQDFKNILELIQVFSTEQICLDRLKTMRWADGAYCPYCGCKKLYEFKDKKNYKCAECRKRFSVKVGSIFEDSKIPLQKWYMAIYLITSHKKGISSMQLAKDISVTQKTAWFMLMRLRFGSKTKAFNEPLSNTVEVDETYVGGKEKNKHFDKRTKHSQGRSTATKTPVLAVIERQGRVIATKTAKAGVKNISNFISKNVVIGSQLMSDEYRSYNAVNWLYKHKIVRHGRGEYVNGEQHTNTIEGFFSLLKRGIVGIYHFVSPKHLDMYLNEFTFRYNSKDMSEQDRFNMFLSNCNGKRLMYNKLTA